MRKLFLDDIRDPKHCLYYMPGRIGHRASIYGDNDWVIVRTYEEFVNWIKKNGVPDLISFDHDLADEHYDPSMYTGKYPDSFTEKTGLDCAKWLCEWCQDTNQNFKIWEVHSMNPIGGERIDSYINQWKNTLK